MLRKQEHLPFNPSYNLIVSLISPMYLSCPQLTRLLIHFLQNLSIVRQNSKQSWSPTGYSTTGKDRQRQDWRRSTRRTETYVQNDDTASLVGPLLVVQSFRDLPTHNRFLCSDPELKEAAENLMASLQAAGIEVDPRQAFEALKIMGEGFENVGDLSEIKSSKGWPGNDDEGNKGSRKA